MGRFAFWMVIALSVCVRVEAADTESVEAVLDAWVKHLAVNQRNGFQGSGVLYTYDTVFCTETRRRVEFWCDGPSWWRHDYFPMQATDEKVRRLNADGVPFELKSSSGCERWVRSGAVMIQQSGFGYGPPDVRGVTVRETAPTKSAERIKLTGFLGAIQRAWEDALARHSAFFMQFASTGFREDGTSPEWWSRKSWVVSLGPMHGKNGRVHLICVPEKDEVLTQLSRMEVLLHATTFRPVAIRFVDPAGTSDHVCAFHRIEDLELAVDPFGEEAIASWPPGRKRASPYEFGAQRPPAPPVAR
jgi:hypothetical protein